MNIDKYKLRVAQSKAGIARHLKDENGWSEASETLKTAYGVQHERKAETRKTADIHPTSRV
ncbi:host cell division inhibitory peptide Kil [Providencia rettgeri]|nr:host cell division inhibitory peptide Kil [Providencia rettgeri]